jgi:hypothetical protein
MPDYLTLPLFKEGLHFDESTVLTDEVMTGFLDAAEAYIGDPESGILRRPVAVTEFAEEFDSLSDVQLRFPDGATIASVTYTDPDDQEQTLGPIYRLSDGCLKLLPGEVWPRAKAPVTVIYTAGFDPVPDPIKKAAYFYAGTLYEAQLNAQMMDPELLRQLMSTMLAGYRRPTL